MAVGYKSTLFVMLLLLAIDSSSVALGSDQSVVVDYRLIKVSSDSKRHPREPDCDLTLAFKESPIDDGIVFTNPGLVNKIRIVARNIGGSVCPVQYLKLLRYQGRQGWIDGKLTELRSLPPGGSTELIWVVHPQQEGYYTYKPQFVGGLADANLSNHKPAKKFQAIFRTHD